ncbi:MAG: hypothetical protein LKE16_05855 [Dialister sp.]|jgi:hypothetical protein|nr:hypothetical protein [Dialister sp.]
MSQIQRLPSPKAVAMRDHVLYGRTDGKRIADFRLSFINGKFLFQHLPQLVSDEDDDRRFLHG